MSIFLQNDDPRFGRVFELLTRDNGGRPQLMTGASLLGDTAKNAMPGAGLVNGLIDDRSITVLYGPSSCGKTTVAASIVRAVLEGLPWCGRPTRRGRVLYISAEVSAANARSVAAAIYDGADQASAQRYNKSLSITMASPPLRPRVAWDNLQWHDLDEWLHALPEFDLVVIDSWADVLGTSGLNEITDVAIAIRALERLIAFTGGAILILHHTAKPKRATKRGDQDERGALQLRMAATYMVPVTLDKADRGEDWIAPTLHFSSEKAKTRHTAKPRDLRMTFRTPRPGGPLLLVDADEVTMAAPQKVEADVPELADDVRSLLEVVASYPAPVSLAGLMAETGDSRSTLQRRLRVLCPQLVTEEKWAGKASLYMASEQGLRAIGREVPKVPKGAQNT